MKPFVRSQQRRQPRAFARPAPLLAVVGAAFLLLAARAESASLNQQARKAAAEAAATFQEIPFADTAANGTLADRANKAADPAAQQAAATQDP